MKKISWHVILIALVILVLVIVVSSKNAFLAPSGFNRPASAAPKIPILTSSSCTYNDLTASVMARFPPNSQLVDMQKIHESYYIMKVDNSTGWYWYTYYLGNDGLLDTQDDRASYGGDYIFRGELTENNGVKRLFYVTTRINYQEIYACTLTPNGCVNTVLIVSIPTNRILIEGIVPSDSQNRLYLQISDLNFPNPTGTAMTGIYSCDLRSGWNDSCILGEWAFVRELLTASYVLSFPDLGFFHSTGSTSRPGNFYDITTRTSLAAVPLAGVNTLSRHHFESTYPLFFTIRNPTTSTSPPELFMLDIASGNAGPVEALARPGTNVNPHVVEFLNNQLISVYSYNNGYFAKQFGMPSTEIMPYDPTLTVTFNPIDILPDRKVVGQLTDTSLGNQGIFRFSCTP